MAETFVTFEIEVKRWNEYGDRLVSRTPAKIVASDLEEVTEKVRAIFAASYDDFRKFWSHTYDVIAVTEAPALVPKAPDLSTGADRG